MCLVSEQDRAYIYGKFRSRFEPNDEAYDMSTGLDRETMARELCALRDSLAGERHALISAKLFRFVLDHTPIALNGRDLYVGLESVNTPVKNAIQIWHDEYRRDVIPHLAEEQAKFLRLGAALIYMDDCHSVPNYDYVLPLGFPGMLAKVREAKAAHASPDAEAESFYAAMEIELEAILRFLDRCIAYAEGHPNERSAELVPCLKQLLTGAPRTFYEALQFIYLYFMLSEHVNGTQVRSLSNFDRLLWPYYQQDLERGICGREKQEEVLAYFLLQFGAINNVFCQPVYFGGTNADGTSVINELSYVFLDVWDSLDLTSPKLQIKLGAETPKPYLRRALEAIRRGHNSIVFVNDDVIRKTLTAFGCGEQAARLANISGCYEYSPPEGIQTLSPFVNMAKGIEFALFNGRDAKTGESVGISLGEAESFSTFDAFFDAVVGYVKYVSDRCMRLLEEYVSCQHEIIPQVLFSAARKSGLKDGRDAYALEAEDGIFSTVELGGLASAADSLAMIKKYVFEEKTCTLSEMKRLMETDFAGAEVFRQKLLSDPDKFGNNRALPDALAKRLAESLADYVNHRPNGKKKGQWITGLHVSTRYLQWRDVTASLPNGRLRGEELSKNASPTQGAAVSGPTSAILSLTKLDASKFMGDEPLDLALVPASVQGEDGMTALLGLLDAFRLRGGTSVHFNCVGSDVLRDAMLHPEKHRDLQIRVCGWNVRYVTLDPRDQEAFIRAAEGAGA